MGINSVEMDLSACCCTVISQQSHELLFLFRSASHVLIHWNENKTYYEWWLFLHLLLPLFRCSINKANLNHLKCIFEKKRNVPNGDVIKTTLRADVQMNDCLVHISAVCPVCAQIILFIELEGRLCSYNRVNCFDDILKCSTFELCS